MVQDENGPKMATGLNLNLEEQALPAGKQCMGTLVTGLRCNTKVTSGTNTAHMASSKPIIPSFDELSTKSEDIFGKKLF